jgi:hypothetical protein
MAAIELEEPESGAETAEPAAETGQEEIGWNQSADSLEDLEQNGEVSPIDQENAGNHSADSSDAEAPAERPAVEAAADAEIADSTAVEAAEDRATEPEFVQEETPVDDLPAHTAE